MDGSTRLAALALLSTLGMAAQAALAQASRRVSARAIGKTLAISKTIRPASA